MRAAWVCTVLLGVLCVMTLTSARLHRSCRQPKKTGRCRAAFPRYFYNRVTGACERFIYGGCGKNSNNFVTIDECVARCGGPRPSPVPSPNPNLPRACRQPKKIGPCRAAFPRYFYNSSSSRCERFLYGGCRQNSNNFFTLDTCRTRCVDY